MLAMLGSGAGMGVPGAGNPLIGVLLIIGVIVVVIGGARWSERFFR